MKILTLLYKALASHGYIVITMDQPYVANFVKFPDGLRTILYPKAAITGS